MMTLSKLAKIANVSVSTASKAFSGSSEVSDQTRQLIFSTAKEYGCFKKFYNARYPKLVIAIIAPEFNSIHYTRCLSSLQAHFGEETCELCVSATNFSPEREQHLLEYYYRHSNVDGIIVMDARTQLEEPYEIPVVFLGSAVPQKHGVSVSVDNRVALEESLQYLKQRSISTVGFIGESLTGRKLAMFKELVPEKGLSLEEDFISISSGRFAPGGYEAMEALFAKKRVPRAIVCAYDYMAIGAIRCILDHGLSVPEDVAVLGFDDIPEAGFFAPPLASISASTEELCRIAAKAVLSQFSGEIVAQQQMLPSQFLLRKSFEIT